MAQEKDIYSVGFGQTQDALTTKVGGVEFNSAGTYGGEFGTKQVDAGSPMQRFTKIMENIHQKTNIITANAVKAEGKRDLVYGHPDADLAEKEAKRANILSRTVWGKVGEGKDEQTLVTNMSTMPFRPNNKYIDLSKSTHLAVPTADVDGVKLVPGRSGGHLGVRVPYQINFQAIGEYDPANPDANKEDIGRIRYTAIQTTKGDTVYAAEKKPGTPVVTVYKPAMSGEPKYEMPKRDKEGNIVKDDKGRTVWEEVGAEKFMKDPRIAKIMQTAENGLKGATIEKNIKQPDNTVKPELRPDGGYTTVGNYDPKVNEEVLKPFAKKTFNELKDPTKEESSIKVAMSRDKESEGQGIKVGKQEYKEREDGTKVYETTKAIKMENGVVKNLAELPRGGVNATITKRERKDVDVDVADGGGSGGSSSPAPKTTRKRDTGIGR